jgi:hypothetical protein
MKNLIFWQVRCHEFSQRSEQARETDASDPPAGIQSRLPLLEACLLRLTTPPLYLFLCLFFSLAESLAPLM